MLNLRRGRLFFFFLSIVGALFFCGGRQGSATLEQNPQQAVENFLKTIRSMDFPVKDPEQHHELVTQANAYLDLESMSQKALEAHWNEATQEEQQAFFTLLWKLIENVAYPRSRRFVGNYEITYPEVHAAGKGFEVLSVIKHEEEALDAKVVYHVYQKDRQWKIDDVILDDVSIIEDLKLQFDKIISQSRFSGLLDKMREKLATAEKENQTPVV
jgi:phospholipid transport system substrate-binding protein